MKVDIHDAGAYGSKWSESQKKDAAFLPTFDQISVGFSKWFFHQLELTMKINQLSSQVAAKVAKNYKNTIAEFMKSIELSNIHENLIIDQDEAKKDSDLNLANPYSKITGFILQLLSMEFGSPPLYAELNRASRMMNLA